MNYVFGYVFVIVKSHNAITYDYNIFITQDYNELLLWYMYIS